MKISDYIKNASDAELEALANRIATERRYRREIEANRVVNELEVGSMIRLKSIRPKYMAGALCRVTAIGRAKVTVDIVEGPAFRGRARHGILVPMTSIELVEEG